MSGKLKIILKIIIITILCFAFLITIDGIRLRNSKLGTKPFIILDTKRIDNLIEYKGIFYAIKYYVNPTDIYHDDKKLIEETGYGAEFRLFNKILIWAYVE